MPIPAMPIRRPLIVSALIIVAMAALSLAAAAALPATVPLRFNAHGVATAYGSPLAPLAIMPLAAVVLSAIFAGLARAEPRRENLILSRLPYATRWIGGVVIVAIVHLWIVYTLVTTVRGAAPIDPTRLVFVLVGATIAIAGGQLGRLRSNFMIGIRTPWTLASDQVWDRTHRLAAGRRCWRGSRSCSPRSPRRKRSCSSLHWPSCSRSAAASFCCRMSCGAATARNAWARERASLVICPAKAGKGDHPAKQDGGRGAVGDAMRESLLHGHSGIPSAPTIRLHLLRSRCALLLPARGEKVGMRGPLRWARNCGAQTR
jgi:uncharacterized membrane protein